MQRRASLGSASLGGARDLVRNGSGGYRNAMRSFLASRRDAQRIALDGMAKRRGVVGDDATGAALIGRPVLLCVRTGAQCHCHAQRNDENPTSRFIDPHDARDRRAGHSRDRDRDRGRGHGHGHGHGNGGRNQARTRPI